MAPVCGLSEGWQPLSETSSATGQGLLVDSCLLLTGQGQILEHSKDQQLSFLNCPTPLNPAFWRVTVEGCPCERWGEGCTAEHVPLPSPDFISDSQLGTNFLTSQHTFLCVRNYSHQNRSQWDPSSLSTWDYSGETRLS